MIGRRLPNADIGADGPGWEAWDQGRCEPGSYMRVDHSFEDHCEIIWYIVDPAGKVGSLRTHTIVEHEDGTITVSPSILDPAPGGWHGWLERGVWRSA